MEVSSQQADLCCLRCLLLNDAMFVGHYSVAFAARSEKNKIPLWILFIAVQFLDYIWATLVLLGIEKLRVVKGFTAGSMLDSYFHPYSHSLIAAIIWSGVAALLYKPLCTWLGYAYSKSAALIHTAFMHRAVATLLSNTPINSPCARYPVMWKGGKAHFP